MGRLPWYPLAHVTSEAGAEISPQASALLAELQHGSNLAVPSVYPGSLAFSDHARLYFDNAAALCRTGAMDDFRVFGVLYHLRHGLELWLKCLLRNKMIDGFLARLYEDPAESLDLERVSNSLGLEPKQQKDLRASLCAFRNVGVDGMIYPECWKVRMESHWADRALVHLRGTGDEPRDSFAVFWRVRLPGHDLQALWEETGASVRGMHYPASCHARESFGALPSVGRIEAICSLLHHYDADGDAFRYPVSLAGKWHYGLPSLSLEALGGLSSELANAVGSFASFRGEVYSKAKLRDPWPYAL